MKINIILIMFQSFFYVILFIYSFFHISYYFILFVIQLSFTLNIIISFIQNYYFKETLIYQSLNIIVINTNNNKNNFLFYYEICIKSFNNPFFY